jgi:hypothetical protein
LTVGGSQKASYEEADMTNEELLNALRLGVMRSPEKTKMGVDLFEQGQLPEALAVFEGLNLKLTLADLESVWQARNLH